MARTEILLETGTNEIEIMKFTVYDELYGINVAKVKEIMMSDKTKPVPHSHEAVEGIFKPRDTVFTVIDLPYYLTGKETTPNARDLFMITSFNRINIAFRVHTIVGIERMGWDEIESPDVTINLENAGISTGIVESEGSLVVILDFEKIIADVATETTITEESQLAIQPRAARPEKILLAEDSQLLRKLILDSIARAGYTNVEMFNNGKELWDHVSNIRKDPEKLDEVKLIITDIEMPQMDGHRLTRLVKEDSVLKKKPVIIFSSLISEEMQIKGREVGADAQLSKPEIGGLVDLIDKFVSK